MEVLQNFPLRRVDSAHTGCIATLNSNLSSWVSRVIVVQKTVLVTKDKLFHTRMLKDSIVYLASTEIEGAGDEEVVKGEALVIQ